MRLCAVVAVLVAGLLAGCGSSNPSPEDVVSSAISGLAAGDEKKVCAQVSPAGERRLLVVLRDNPLGIVVEATSCEEAISKLHAKLTKPIRAAMADGEVDDAKVTGDKEWMEWVHKSARGIMKSGVPEQQTPGFWNNVGQCCGSAGVAEFFLHLHTLTGSKEYLAFSERMTGQLLAAGTRDAKGLYWVHAEHRVRPKEVFAQTGWMQGAAGIGAWVLRLDAYRQNRPSPMRFPDLPF